MRINFLTELIHEAASDSPYIYITYRENCHYSESETFESRFIISSEVEIKISLSEERMN